MTTTTFAPADTNTISISLGPHHQQFRPWLPADGKIFDCCAIDLETTEIIQERPDMIPRPVLGVACDEKRAVMLAARDLPAFVHAHSSAKWIFHNAAFDMAVLQQWAANGLDIYGKIERNEVWCTLVLRRLLQLATDGDPGLDRAGLKASAEDVLGCAIDKEAVDDHGEFLRTKFGQFLGRSVAQIPVKFLRYACTDVWATWQLFWALKSRITKLLKSSQGIYGHVDDAWLQETVKTFGPLTHHVQLRASIVTDVMHRNGIGVDLERVNTLRQTLEEKLAALKIKLASEGYHPGVSGCDKFIQARLQALVEQHETLSLPRSESGEFWSTTEEDLVAVAAIDPFFTDFIDYSHTQKLISTYLSKLTAERIHPNFGYLLKTGRTSCGQPSMQNLPRENHNNDGPTIRSCFVAAPGHVFVAPDYKQIELVALAFALVRQMDLGDTLQKLVNSGIDVHRLIASQVLGKPVEDVTSSERQSAKAVSFGRPGGMGAATLQEIARREYGVNLSLAEVEQRIHAYHDICPELDWFLQDEVDSGKVLAGAIARSCGWEFFSGGGLGLDTVDESHSLNDVGQ